VECVTRKAIKYRHRIGGPWEWMKLVALAVLLNGISVAIMLAITSPAAIHLLDRIVVALR